MKLLEVVNLEKPLFRGTYIKCNNRSVWLEFRYEQLATFCYYCGKIGHLERNCGKKRQDTSEGQLQEDQYGEWIRASPIGRSSQQAVEKNRDFVDKHRNSPNVEVPKHSEPERSRPEHPLNGESVIANSERATVPTVISRVTPCDDRREEALLILEGRAENKVELERQELGYTEIGNLEPRVKPALGQGSRETCLEGLDPRGALNELWPQPMETHESLVNVPVQDMGNQIVLRTLDSNIARMIATLTGTPSNKHGNVGKVRRTKQHFRLTLKID